MSKRILVVEDQPDSRRIIRDMLAPTNYEITEAGNGEEALAAIAKQRPDLTLGGEEKIAKAAPAVMTMCRNPTARVNSWRKFVSICLRSAVVVRCTLSGNGPAATLSGVLCCSAKRVSALSKHLLEPVRCSFLGSWRVAR